MQTRTQTPARCATTAPPATWERSLSALTAHQQQTCAQRSDWTQSQTGVSSFHDIHARGSFASMHVLDDEDQVRSSWPVAIFRDGTRRHAQVSWQELPRRGVGQVALSSVVNGRR